MKMSLFRVALVALTLCGTSLSRAAESGVTADLEALVAKIQKRIAAGNHTEEALAPDIAEFDKLLAKYGAEKTDEVAQILVLKASLYWQILQDEEKTLALYQQLKRDFPGTTAGAEADRVIAVIERQQAAQRIRQALAVGSKFPEFSEPGLAGKTVALTDYRGKIVLIDFWATWCGPCLAELPEVVATYHKHHEAGFDVIGISLDHEDGRQMLIDFTKKHAMPWMQIYDGGFWESKLVRQYGVSSIPTTFLLDREGVIVAKDLRGPELEEEVTRLLAKP